MDEIEDATAERLESMRARLLRTARRLGHSAADAEELVQDALAAAVEKMGSFREESNLRTWVYRIFFNRRIDAFRRRSRRAVPAARPSEDPADLASARERHEAVREALIRLPEPMQRLLTLRYLEERPYAEIAAMCGELEGTLRSRLFEALERLRGLLEERV